MKAQQTFDRWFNTLFALSLALPLVTRLLIAHNLLDALIIVMLAFALGVLFGGHVRALVLNLSSEALIPALIRL